MRNNYHTHTYLCKHAEGNVNDYVKKAVELGMEEIGISDHGPLLHNPFPRMTIFEFFNVYLKEIEKAQEEYKGQIKVYKSLELEYLDKDYDYIQSLREHLDYLVLGCHYYSSTNPCKETSTFHIDTVEKLSQYVQLVEHALDTGFFKIIAHPDMFFLGYKKFDDYARSACRRIIEAAIRNDVYLEINANGMRRVKHRGYPREEFFQMAKNMNAKIIIGADAHHPDELDDEAVKDAEEFAKSLEIKVCEKAEF